MSQPSPLLRVTGAVLADKRVTIPARAAFRSAAGKDYPAKPESSFREVQVATVAAFDGEYADGMQAVLSVKLGDNLPPLAAGEVIDWYVSAWALTKPGNNGRSPYPVVALSFVCDIEPAPVATKSRAA